MTAEAGYGRRGCGTLVSARGGSRRRPGTAAEARSRPSPSPKLFSEQRDLDEGERGEQEEHDTPDRQRAERHGDDVRQRVSDTTQG